MGSKIDIQLFCERFASSGGLVHHASCLDDAASAAVNILCARKGRIHVAQSLRNTVIPHMQRAGLDSPLESSPADYDQHDSGITEARNAVAEAGCLVEVAEEESVRLASSATDVHVALLCSSAVVASLSDLSGVIRRELSVSGVKPVITLIGGPSRTSDIELKDVIGVHGPREVHVIVYECDAR